MIFYSIFFLWFARIWKTSSYSCITVDVDGVAAPVQQDSPCLDMEQMSLNSEFNCIVL